MNKEAIKKHEIYHKLVGFSGKELDTIANFIDVMRHQKNMAEKKVIKLEGILRNQPIDFSDLKQFKRYTWEHVDQEFGNG
ncbi:MAG: hypothetical protein ACOZF0_08860 [Thermodesulfobacteriota bacterium]